MAVRLTLEAAGEAGVDVLLSCPCSEVIIKATGAGGGKVRGKVVILRTDGVYAVCKSCDSEVKLPLTWTRSLQPAVDTGPPLYLDK
jgi:hypothetical protein